MKKPLGALILSAAAVGTLAVPAGAANSKDWTQVKFPCAKGHKFAVLGYSPTHPYWKGFDENAQEGIVNPHGWASWLSNPCKGQWLVFATWNGEPSEASYTAVSLGTGMSGKYPGVTSARLVDAPICFAGTSDAHVIQKPGRPTPTNCADAG